MLYEQPTNEFVRDFIGRTLLFKGKVQSSDATGHIAVAIDGTPDCVVCARTYAPGGIGAGFAVHLAVRPEDVEIVPANRQASGGRDRRNGRHCSVRRRSH